ncbi:hypothetical protein PR001_g29665 [Phytophthora rubi]|uniref:MTTase N-terminal domain-containing protein n=1 Tax=Phytophthora rubi TaxID=129364 RepID=A0A6A3H0B6_9STRA|nr:hypothetical protein PR002_g29601 [Phytophthora rubi]KAE8962574.1 hypothetical protein PR001_g29665 [Phytophthora rubi]
MNTADSEIVRAILLEGGYTSATAAEGADVLFINTCAVRDNAEAKIWNRLESLRQMVHVVVGPDVYRDIPNVLRIVYGRGEAAVNAQVSLDETFADIAPVREGGRAGSTAAGPESFSNMFARRAWFPLCRPAGRSLACGSGDATAFYVAPSEGFPERSSGPRERAHRGSSRMAYLALVDNMRTRVAISSYFITGFCGETEEEHTNTISLMRQAC